MLQSHGLNMREGADVPALVERQSCAGEGRREVRLASEHSPQGLTEGAAVVTLVDDAVRAGPNNTRESDVSLLARAHQDRAVPRSKQPSQGPRPAAGLLAHRHKGEWRF